MCMPSYPVVLEAKLLARAVIYVLTVFESIEDSGKTMLIHRPEPWLFIEAISTKMSGPGLFTSITITTPH